MQTCTIPEASVNLVETWAVRLWREAENVAIRDLVRDGDQSTLQTTRVFKLEVFADALRSEARKVSTGGLLLSNEALPSCAAG
jgi:hypothetical protein